MSSTIRNFSIIAHIDAGKSTLADRFLELTHTVAPNQMKQQILDSNPIERERGITIKLAPVTMAHSLHGQKYTLNLIDTPGHVDFNYEVERALQACEGAILLIDGTKGVQAQTVANLRLAQKQNLTVIPAINKVDANLADIEACTKQIKVLLPQSSTPLLVSAKTGQNTPQLLQSVIDQVPPPDTTLSVSSESSSTQALIFNSTFHPHLGVIAFVRVFSGQLKTGDQLQFLSNSQKFTPTEIGIFTPQRYPQQTLSSGSVGYLVTGLKDIRAVNVGDTVTLPQTASSTSPLPGFRQIKPHLYQDVFPTEGSEYLDLLSSLEKLQLNDASLDITPINSPVLGQGVKVGFLGLLHAEVITERLEREFNLSVIAVAPSVEYQIKLTSKQDIFVHSATDLPDPTRIKQALEPYVSLQVITPEEYLGPLIQLCQESRGQLQDMTYLDQLVKLEYHMPLVEVITNLHDTLKSVSSGFASLDYQFLSYQPVDLVKLTVILNHENFPPLSTLCPRSQSVHRARKLAKKLKEIIPRQQFEIPIQVAIGGKIIARETVKAFRKDVTAKLYGGDNTRRTKLLQKQKKGKKRLKQFGRIQLPQEAFLAAFK